MKNFSEIRDGMRIEWNVPVTMDDGITLRADIFRPIEEGKYPIILSMGPYGKGLHFEEGYHEAWEYMVSNLPEVMEGSTNKYQNWEVVDPGCAARPVHLVRRAHRHGRCERCSRVDRTAF